jgi:hypothetical protein
MKKNNGAPGVVADKEVRMYLELTPQQVSELDTLIDSTLRDMSHEIAATDNSHYRRLLFDRRNVLRSLAGALHAPGCNTEPLTHDRGVPVAIDRVWTVEVVFTEDEDRTRADARLRGAKGDRRGWGRARRNPGDPDVPMIGEELAAARALSDLSHQLLDAAAREIERFEGHAVRLHT